MVLLGEKLRGAVMKAKTQKPISKLPSAPTEFAADEPTGVSGTDTELNPCDLLLANAALDRWYASSPAASRAFFDLDGAGR